MKSSDIALVILIVGLVGFGGYFVVDYLMPAPSDSKADTLQKVTTTEKFSSTVADPDKAVFNEYGYNPTVEAKIGDTGTDTPFKKEDTN